MFKGIVVARLAHSGSRTLIFTSRTFGTDVDRIDLKNELPIVKQNSFPSPAAAALKRGTGGRSSFNGTVCTVFGANGLVGRRLVNRLGKVGTQIIIPHRSDPRKYAPLKLAGDLGQIVFLPYYLRDEDSLYRAMKYSNVVVNLIGKQTETANFSFDEVHVEGARRLARIAREAGVQRFVHMSALGADPNPRPQVIGTGSRFLRSKYMGEQAVREEFPEAIIFRPSDIYGENDDYIKYYTHWYRRSFKKILLWKMGKGVYKMPVHVNNVAEGITNAIFDNSAPGKIYDAVGPRKYELYEIVQYINRVTQRDEHNTYSLNDMRWRPWFWARVYFQEWFRKYPVVSWEKIEKENISDVLTPGHPTLEDLGVKLDLFEVWGKYHGSLFDRFGYYQGHYGEEPEPELPKFITP